MKTLSLLSVDRYSTALYGNTTFVDKIEHFTEKWKLISTYKLVL